MHLNDRIGPCPISFVQVASDCDVLTYIGGVLTKNSYPGGTCIPKHTCWYVIWMRFLIKTSLLYLEHIGCVSCLGNLSLLGWFLWRKWILSSRLRTQLVWISIKRSLTWCSRRMWDHVISEVVLQWGSSWMDPRGSSSPVLHCNTRQVSCRKTSVPMS